MWNYKSSTSWFSGFGKIIRHHHQHHQYLTINIINTEKYPNIPWSISLTWLPPFPLSSFKCKIDVNERERISFVLRSRGAIGLQCNMECRACFTSVFVNIQCSLHFSGKCPTHSRVRSQTVSLSHSTNKIFSLSNSIVHGKLEVKWREIFAAVLSFSYTFTAI